VNIQSTYDGFTFKSVKCRRRIPFVAAVLHDHLIQQTLDRAVSAIDYIDETVAGPIDIDVRHIVVYRADRGFLQNVGTAREADVSSHMQQIAGARGMQIETVAARDIMAEPRFTAVRSVWAQRQVRADLGMRVAIKRELADDGPLPPRRTLRSRAGSPGPGAAIPSLACKGVVHLDLSGGFGPHTIVRSGS
jgi:hypothetical protein